MRRESLTQLCRVLVSVQRVAGVCVPNERGRAGWFRARGRRGTEFGVGGTVVRSAGRIVRPAHRLGACVGSRIRVATPAFGSGWFDLDRTARDVAAEDYSAQCGAPAGDVDAHVAAPPVRSARSTQRTGRARAA